MLQVLLCFFCCTKQSYAWMQKGLEPESVSVVAGVDLLMEKRPICP